MFTAYYFLAVGVGAFAVLVSVIGIKSPEKFPGKLYGLVILGGVILGVATFAAVWHGGEKEVEHREAEESGHHAETSSVIPLPVGIKSVA
jgi:hypothetical protein